MSVIVKINSVDKSEFIELDSLFVEENLTSLVDTAKFIIKKIGDRVFVPEFNDDVEVWDGAVQIFGGKILIITENIKTGAGGIVYECSCVDHTYEMDKVLASKTYENETVAAIITDLLSSYAPTFNANNVDSTYVVTKIVFNQVSISSCIKKLAEMLRYDWYVDVDKSVHFFSKFSKSAPFNITDTSANYIFKTLERNVDGSQLVNRVKVRGGEYDGSTYTDSITVKGNVSKSFRLPYKMSNLTVKLNTVSKTVGIDFIDDFTTKDVLFSYQDQTFRFENALADGDVIEYSGNPKVRVLAVAEDGVSIASYGAIEKLVRDDSIKDNTLARRRAAAELYAYAVEVVDAKFETYESGLHTGQTINIQSTLRGSDDNLIIKRVSYKMIDPMTFGYSVQLVSTKRFGLIEMLQKLMEPAALDADENEVSETIYTTSEELTITEEIELVAPFDADDTLTIGENVLLNPVDPADVEFVLGPYTPKSYLTLLNGYNYAVGSGIGTPESLPLIRPDIYTAQQICDMDASIDVVGYWNGSSWVSHMDGFPINNFTITAAIAAKMYIHSTGGGTIFIDLVDPLQNDPKRWGIFDNSLTFY